MAKIIGSKAVGISSGKRCDLRLVEFESDAFLCTGISL